MRPFTYVRVQDVRGAVSAGQGEETKYLGGGTNLLDLMKTGVEQPAQLVDVTRVPMNRIEEHSGGVWIGAMVRNTEAANHELIRRRYPLLSQAILSGATAQLRNMATMGGNLMQRTRCSYFYDPTMGECNKRDPGSGCAARTGYNRMHAILGASGACIAVNPSDMNVALAALDAVVQVTGANGGRSIAIGDFHRLPGDTPQFDTTLHRGELIIGIELPALAFGSHSSYLKVRDRNSYAFALVSVAAAVDVDGNGNVREARVALGGVAHKPWRVPEAERVMVGKKAGEAAFGEAAELLVLGAKVYRYNGFKVELARRAVVRALTDAAAG
jgi:xanthine dehydrogenase YagS FAD-binding subunit